MAWLSDYTYRRRVALSRSSGAVTNYQMKVGVAENSWLPGWSYRKLITLSRASGAVTNYQMKILVGESSGATGEDVDCGGLCLSSFDDLRFTNATGTVLDYWIESITGATPNQLATIWVEFDSIGTSDTTFFMYYGNASAAAYSNISDTFAYGEDFEWGVDGDDIDTDGGSIDWSKNVAGSSTAKIDTGQKWGGSRSLELYMDGTNSPQAYFDNTDYTDNAVRLRFRKDGTSQGYILWGNGTQIVYVIIAANEGVYYLDASGDLISSGQSVSVNTWHLFEVYNIDFTAGTYSLSLDGVEILTDVEMFVSASVNGRILLMNAIGSSSCWYDDVIVRDWLAVEPAFGTWGDVEEGAVGCEGLCLSSFNDIRFTNSDGETTLPYWIEEISGATPNQLATVWVKFDSIGTTDTYFYMYYGNASAAAYSNGTNTFKKFEDFEWGADGDNIDTNGGSVTWTKVVAGSSTAKIDSGQKWGGARSLELYRDGTNNSLCYFGNTDYSGYSIRFRFRKDATSQGRFIWGNPAHVIYLLIGADERIYYYNAAGTPVDSGYTVSVDTWHLFDIYDIDFTAGTYCVSLDGAEILTDVEMQDSAAWNGLTALYNSGGTSSCWFDDIILRDWLAVEPTWGSWESTESYIKLYESHTTGDDLSYPIYMTQYGCCQTFKNELPHYIDNINVKVKRTGNPNTLIAYLVNSDEGGNPVFSNLLSDKLISDSIATSGISDSAFEWVNIQFDEPYLILADTYYGIVLLTAGMNSSNKIDWACASGTTGYSNGIGLKSSSFANASSTYYTDANCDFMFEEYGLAVQPSTDSFEYYLIGEDTDYDCYDSFTMASQSFTPLTSHSLESVMLKLKRTGSPGDAALVIMGADEDGLPDGSPPIDYDRIQTFSGNSVSDEDFRWVQVTLDTPLDLSLGKYCAVLIVLSGNSSNKLEWAMDSSSSTYPGGVSSYGDAMGFTTSSGDFLFEALGTSIGTQYTKEYSASLGLTSIGVRYTDIIRNYSAYFSLLPSITADQFEALEELLFPLTFPLFMGEAEGGTQYTKEYSALMGYVALNTRDYFGVRNYPSILAHKPTGLRDYSGTRGYSTILSHKALFTRLYNAYRSALVACGNIAMQGGINLLYADAIAVMGNTSTYTRAGSVIRAYSSILGNAPYYVRSEALIRAFSNPMYSVPFESHLFNDAGATEYIEDAIAILEHVANSLRKDSRLHIQSYVGTSAVVLQEYFDRPDGELNPL
jgi:hypothetical protein